MMEKNERQLISEDCSQQHHSQEQQHNLLQLGMVYL
jgi:hypothetical protein